MDVDAELWLRARRFGILWLWYANLGRFGREGTTEVSSGKHMALAIFLTSLFNRRKALKRKNFTSTILPIGFRCCCQKPVMDVVYVIEVIA